MRLLILTCCVTLAGCLPRPVEYRTVPLTVPDSLTAPVAKPERPLVTYKDAVVRDAERGLVIDKMNEDRAAVRKIVSQQ